MTTVISDLDRKRAVRIALLVLVVVPVVIGLVAAGIHEDPEREFSNATTISNGTVIVTHEPGNLFIYSSAGSVQYRNTTYDQYNDIDEINGTNSLVYVASDHRRTQHCPDKKTRCTTVVIEKLNLSSLETTRVYSQTNAGHRARGWHDVDRINESTYVVADIFEDRVFVLNTTTGIRTWTWNAQSWFPLSGGGAYPGDWTHINDVEILPDGRFMVSVRNQDQVVFLNRSGVEQQWTLGSDDRHEIVSGQHNPDYIPASRGGPAAIVADSGNNRIIEYQRQNNTWTKSWVWTDSQMIWPRDADRLPNNHTLITDTNGDRVLETNENGTIVWKVAIDGAYEAERLNTGDESAGGYSATAADLRPHSQANAGSGLSKNHLLILLKRLVPQPVVSGLTYILPEWMPFYFYALPIISVGSAVVWIALELYWNWQYIRFRSPILFDK